MRLVEAETETRVLIVAHGVVNTTIGVSLWMWSNLSAENALSAFVPPIVWPFLFLLAGMLAFCGLCSRQMAQFSFVFAAFVTGIFGLASLVAVLRGNLGAISTTAFLLYIAALKLYVSYVLRQRDRIVETITRTTIAGQSVLDQVTDGAERS